MCALCQGAGYVHPLLPNGRPDYSRVVACRCSDRQRDAEQHRHLLRYSNLGALTRCTFDNLNPRGRSGQAANQALFAAACEAARAFAAAPQGWLVLSGPTSSGKTHLAAAIANARIERGEPVLFVSVPDLLDRLRASFSPASEVPYDEFFDEVRSAPLLILDDLGVQSSTTWAREKLDQLLNYRFNGGLPTVIVTIAALDRLDERLRSRLSDSGLCRVCRVEETADAAIYGWAPNFVLQQAMTFKSFDRRPNLTAEQQQNLEAAFNLALNFAKSPEGWLVLMGETGCGKTHLASAIVNHQYQAGRPALFVVVADFLDHLRATFNPESKVSYDRLFEGVKTAPLLVLDDFGEQTTTPWAREKLYQVINYRYNARLAMVITTRSSLEELLDGAQMAISSRLVDHKISTPFNIIAPDYRGDLPAPPTRDRRGQPRRKSGWD